ncbi:MAG TPA: alpha/beta fold hydrolase [Blastocatellia bacterium]|nr:alpha/beta fold hydrolase [Blastocatellia bacterium]
MPHVETDGARIYWEERGAGEPLLMIMGLGYSLEMWGRIVPALAEHYRVIVFDNRGVGRSDVPAGPYTIAGMAADAAAVMRAAGLERAHVLGVSMGGMIAQEFALQYPEHVHSLVLGCTAFGGPKAVPASPAVITLLFARATMEPEDAVRAMVPHIYDAHTPRERIEEDLAMRRRTLPTAEGYLAQVRAVLSWSSETRLSQIEAPTLVIHGETDELVPAANGRLIAERIPGAELVLLPQASHIYFTDQPEASMAATLRFLRRHPMS